MGYINIMWLFNPVLIGCDSLTVKAASLLLITCYFEDVMITQIDDFTLQTSDVHHFHFWHYQPFFITILPVVLSIR